jgi:hypothetical protein
MIPKVSCAKNCWRAIWLLYISLNTAPMNKAGKAIVTAGLLSVFGAAAYFSVYQTGRLSNSDNSTNVLSGLACKLTDAVPVEELSGLIALDVYPLLPTAIVRTCTKIIRS